MTCHKVSSNMTVSPHIAHQTKVVVLISPRTSGLCTLFFGLLKQHLGGCQAPISTVVMKQKGLFVNSCECKSQICTMTECLNSYVDGKNA